MIGLLMVFLVLAAQFESWAVPFAVILAAFAIFGALAAVWVRGFTNDIYFQIGLVTLIGLSAKNAILIVEFANTRYEAGKPLIEAAIEAARLRFRPNYHDVDGLHLRHVPAGDCDGRRRREPAIHRHRRAGRHACRHVLAIFRAVVLRVDQEADGPDPGAVAPSAKPRCFRKEKPDMRPYTIIVLSALLMSCALGPD